MVLRFAAGFSRSFSLSFRPSSLPPSLAPFFLLAVGLWYLQIQIPGGPLSPLRYITRPALLLRPAPSILLRHHSLPPCPPSRPSPPSSPLRSPRPSLARFFLSSRPLSLVLTQGPSATCASGAAHSPAYTPLGVQHLPTWPRHNCIRARPTVDPVHTPRLPASIHRTKFIPPPPSNDFITLLRTFNSKLLLRPGHQRAKGGGGEGSCVWKLCAEAAAGGGLVLIYAPVRKKEAAYSRTLRDATRRASRGGSLMTIA